ncbi:MAG: aminotransferase class I/II-fold pyridoxal phosphate-dependent enzyme [Chloroflexi bacterium]|nr:aminotransferase class I/II-fold pyridoxal phosphate-dependent enzyme [Chloroflexota bacterium]
MGPMASAIAQRAERWRVVEPASGWPREMRFEHTIDLSGDSGDPVLPENVLAAVEASLDQGETHYTDRPGVPALRKAVAAKLAALQGVTVDAGSGVVISNGGREGVFVGLQVLASAGDEVLAPELRPAFVDEGVRLSQATLVPVPLRAADGFAMTAAQIKSRLTPKSKLLLLVNPATPSGAVLSAEEIGRIADLVAEHRLTVIADESLDEGLGQHARHVSLASVPAAAPHTLTVCSFSYLYGLASWRVGYFAGPKELVTPVRDLKQAITICTSAMAQFAALEAMTGPQGWVEARRAEMDAKRALVLAALDELGLPHSQPQATPYVFVDVRSSGKKAEPFACWLLSEARVAVLPGPVFGAKGEGWVRISLWPTMSDLEQAMRRLKWALNVRAGGAA